MLKPIKPNEKAEMIKTIRRIAEDLGTPYVSAAQFCKHSHFTRYQAVRSFGSYNGLVEAAGLVRAKFQPGPKHSKEEILAEILRVLRLPNSQLTLSFFKRNSTMSQQQCQRRYGSWHNALQAAARKLHPKRDRALSKRIRAHMAVQTAASKDAHGAADGTLPPLQARDEDSPLPAADGDVPGASEACYGELLRFRRLEHAPINEQGVVFLFGMICHDLGYLVEMLKPGFPDCEAKREVRPGIWQRVRIEFEFRSRTFRTHRHDPRKCDLIVCWENNWPDCPIEVQELKSLLPRLSG